jgi:hypothetical protein
MISVFDKQDSRLEKSLELFTHGDLNNIYAPYFEWKRGKSNIINLPEEKGRKMMNTASEELENYFKLYPDAYSHLDSHIDDDPWQSYKGFGEDRYKVCALQEIEDEISELIVGRMMQG